MACSCNSCFRIGKGSFTDNQALRQGFFTRTQNPESLASPSPYLWRDVEGRASARNCPKAVRHLGQVEPKMVVSRDPERSVLSVREHRKREESPFAGRHGLNEIGRASCRERVCQYV